MLDVVSPDVPSHDYIATVGLTLLTLLSGCNISDPKGATPVDYVTVDLKVGENCSDIEYAFKLGRLASSYHAQVVRKLDDGKSVSVLQIAISDGRELIIRPQLSGGCISGVQVNTDFSFLLRSDDIQFPDAGADGVLMVKAESELVGNVKCPKSPEIE